MFMRTISITLEISFPHEYKTKRARYLRLAIKSNNASAARACECDTFGFRKKAEVRAIDT